MGGALLRGAREGEEVRFGGGGWFQKEGKSEKRRGEQRRDPFFCEVTVHHNFFVWKRFFREGGMYFFEEIGQLGIEYFN